MPLYKPVDSLLNKCFLSLELLTAQHTLEISRRICSKADRLERMSKQETLDSQTLIELTRNLTKEAANMFSELIYSCIPGHLIQTTSLHLLRGLERAVNIKNVFLKKVDCDSNMSGIQHSREMSIIINFSDIIITERLTSLDLSEIPKIIRAHLFDKLDSFTGLKILNLGSGSGGWSDLYISKFISGIRQMKFLTSFSLCYDCNDDILKILTRNCKTTLRVVDVEMCKRVTNQGAEYLSSCNKIEKLHLFHTGINSQGHMNLVLSLKNLKILVRGDFLCETLELIDKDKRIKKVELRLEEFWSSEEYYFHDLYQMQLVQKYCPLLRKIMFQFSKEVMQNVLFLADFKYLSDLHLWGGDFYEDGLNQLLEQIGPQLIILYLIHTENMDKSAIILISRVCPNLQTLGLYNCELQEDMHQDDHEGEDVDPFGPRNTGGFREFGYKEPQMEPLLEISVLHIVSQCPESIFLLLLSSTLNVEEELINTWK
ncbi:uncharacterized protein LOC111698835 isoform X2 [Eurytemora carolleeae]|uniref:uncharacterized protein LOC111698835 isoform X2 n=1 Tax=Eurytemora carolleeae TaxID=1294199 RepID=UPI000C781567|nr:uncharacterized protein LOC111698835 isoform X2 [Eurytemora carolleeae]|eukprot:XP_023325053.1 uncharacterized protein LOC111698835 isoform X2 [Eurytemora affinis]